MRGDNLLLRLKVVDHSGSPPHARGQLVRRHESTHGSRFTPACAGTTPSHHLAELLATVHPRMRGDNFTSSIGSSQPSGSPPHARGQLNQQEEQELLLRFTPACAGTTGCSASACACQTVHPRMRGDNWARNVGNAVLDGSPPHARGQRVIDSNGGRWLRFTPACAGTTHTTRTLPGGSSVHPRMRGDN